MTFTEREIALARRTISGHDHYSPAAYIFAAAILRNVDAPPDCKPILTLANGHWCVMSDWGGWWLHPGSKWKAERYEYGGLKQATEAIAKWEGA